MMNPEEDEISRTPHGSFIKVSGVDLAEIEGREHSCGGPDFDFQLHFSFKQNNMSKCKSPDSKTCCKANAFLKCVYFPIEQGKENIDKVLEELGTRENFETFSRVSIRRLGRLLPEARWGLLPFMDLKQKRGTTAHLLKKCFMRVKCFIDTDAGFNATQLKTDLSRHSQFTAALRNFGNLPLENENEIKVEIYKEGNLLNPFQLEKKYEEWIIQMHGQYDDVEADCGEDQPVFVSTPANKKALCISPDVYAGHLQIKPASPIFKSPVLSGSTIQESASKTLDQYGHASDHVIDCSGKGTIDGVFKFNEGLAAFSDSRSTLTEGNNHCYLDSTNKSYIISRRSNLFFLGAGKNKQWRALVKHLEIRVMVKESTAQFLVDAMMEDTVAVVSIEECLALVQTYLHSFAIGNPNNESIFGGILVGVGPGEKYQAYGVCLVKTVVHQPRRLTGSQFLLCGTGTEFALSKLQELNINPQARTGTMSVAAITASIHNAYLNSPFIGGPANIFIFRDGIDMTGLPDLVLDPFMVHLENHEVESDKIILLLLNKNAAGQFDLLEQSFAAWPEVVCTSRLTGRRNYWLYRVYCKDAASALQAFRRMIQRPALARDRDSKIDPRFDFVICNIGNMEKKVYVAPCSLPLLEFLDGFTW